MTRLAETAGHAARMTGLPKAVCMTLLEDRWTLVSEIGQPLRWEEPRVRYGEPEERNRLELIA